MASQGTVGPSIWVVSDGRAGIERQALAIARALGDMNRWPLIAHIRSEAHRPDPIRLTPSAPQVWLPPTAWPDPLGALPAQERAQLKAPWPDIWIGSGRRSVPYSLRVKSWSKGKTLVVQTQDPKAPLDNFDLVIPPEHDQLDGPNVLSTIGSPAYFAAGDIEQAALDFGDLANAPGLKIAVIIGGGSKTHSLPPGRAAELEQELTALAGKGTKLWITLSRRTPEHARIRFRRMAEKLGARFFENEATDGPNPYLAYLSLADIVMVTEDSSNMISEAAWFAKPIYLLRLQGRSDKFDRLHDSFLKRGIARWFDGDVELYQTEPLREIDRVADRIVELLLEKHRVTQSA